MKTLASTLALAAATATSPTLEAMSELPSAASCTIRPISPVVTLCSSTAVAMSLWMLAT